MFDKADREQHLESLRTEQALLVQQLKDLEGQVQSAEEGEGVRLESELQRLCARADFVETTLRGAEEHEGG